MKSIAPFVLSALLVHFAIPVLGQGPGFRGGRRRDEAFFSDRADFHFLLENHDKIHRTVKEIELGVKTVTESKDAEVAQKIRQHVAAMYKRVEQSRPIRMRDPLFAEIFRHAKKIKLSFEPTENGIRVAETSDDPYVASLIKAHAKVVSLFVKHGFQEAHKSHAIPNRPSTPTVDGAASIFLDFDRVFIPALALTNRKQPAAAMVAWKRLSTSWNERFAAEFFRLFQEDSQWPADFSQIAQSIALAGATLESGALLEAHETLEPIRDQLMEARQRNGFEYPLDSLSHFHRTMEAIVKPAMQLSPDTLTPKQLEMWQTLVKQAEREWQFVENIDFGVALANQSEAKRADFTAIMQSMSNAIAELQTALDTNQPQTILTAARGLKPPFAKAYMFFGEFPESVK